MNIHVYWFNNSEWILMNGHIEQIKKQLEIIKNIKPLILDFVSKLKIAKSV